MLNRMSRDIYDPNIHPDAFELVPNAIVGKLKYLMKRNEKLRLEVENFLNEKPYNLMPWQISAATMIKTHERVKKAETYLLQNLSMFDRIPNSEINPKGKIYQYHGPLIDIRNPEGKTEIEIPSGAYLLKISDTEIYYDFMRIKYLPNAVETSYPDMTFQEYNYWINNK